MTKTKTIPVQPDERRNVKNMPVEIIVIEEENADEVIAKSIFEAIQILLNPN